MKLGFSKPPKTGDRELDRWITRVNEQMKRFWRTADSPNARLELTETELVVYTDATAKALTIDEDGIIFYCGATYADPSSIIFKTDEETPKTLALWRNAHTATNYYSSFLFNSGAEAKDAGVSFNVYAPTTKTASLSVGVINDPFGDSRRAWIVFSATGATSQVSIESDSIVLQSTLMKRDVDDSSLLIAAGTARTTGASLYCYGRDHATYPGQAWVTFGGYDAAGAVHFVHRLDSSYATKLALDLNGRVVLGGGTFPTTGTNALTILSGTAPTTGALANSATAYVKDAAADRACYCFRCEDGTEVLIVQRATGIADADGTLPDITTKFNTLLTYLENVGFLPAA